MHPEPFRTYNIDRNINYTNTCNAFCSFCAFYRPPHHAEGYVLPAETIEQKIRETYALGGNQILLQGGHNPQWFQPEALVNLLFQIAGEGRNTSET